MEKNCLKLRMCEELVKDTGIGLHCPNLRDGDVVVKN